MYPSLRCIAFRTTARSSLRVSRPQQQERCLHSSPARNQPSPPTPSDPPGAKSEGDKSRSREPSTSTHSKWRRRQALQEQNFRDRSLMFVDPVSGQAEILDPRSAGRKAGRPSRDPEPVPLPEWFAERCVVSPALRDELVTTSGIVLLPSTEKGKPGYSFTNGAQRGVPVSDSKGKPARELWLDPLLYSEIEGVIRTSLELAAGGAKETLLSMRSAISLHSPLDGTLEFLGRAVEYLAHTQKAGLLRLDAQDLAELGGDYVSPDAFLDQSLQTLGFDVHAEQADEAMAEEEETLDEEEEYEEEEQRPKPRSGLPKAFIYETSLDQMPNVQNFLKRLSGSGTSSEKGSKAADHRRARSVPKSQDPASGDFSIELARLESFLNALIDTAWAKIKQNELLDGHSSKDAKLIICVEDFIGISNTKIGQELTEKLADIVRKRRQQKHEKLVLVGMSIDKDILPTKDAEKTVQWETEQSILRTIIVTPHLSGDKILTSQEPVLQKAHEARNLRINLRNWHAITSRMAPALAPDRNVTLSASTPTLGHALNLNKGILTQDEVHRLATAAIARAMADDRGQVTSDDLVQVADMFRHIDAARHSKLQLLREIESTEKNKETGGTVKILDFNSFLPDLALPKPEVATPEVATDMSMRLRALQKQADRYEKRLISGIILPENIKTTFQDVHVAKETTEAVRDLTALSLQRPDAFQYGILAKNTLSGLLLYGPPGTGKTMLARAVAKESEATVLTVTGSDVNQMWVGESEKTVKAIFSLARKLSPCVVFLDEADGLLASRSNDGRSRPNHRDTINQFLLEWDGMNETGVFLMVATNRPFDLDDAVLRRLPRRVLIDLPLESDREAILRIHLSGEELDSSISIPELAAQTPYYSGSDLKNLVVSAALTAVKQEIYAKNAATANGEEYTFPAKRVLTKAHFEKALGEIGASVSGDMGSLRQIKKFDEQFGDRKGRRKKNPFGLVPLEENERDARVRA